MENKNTDTEVVLPKVIQIDEFDRVLAVNKLAKEMEIEHSSAEDMVHNYLSDRIPADDELVDGILKADRTIKGAMTFCVSKARKQAEKGATGAMVSDDEVFEWVREYFILDKVDISQSAGQVTHLSKPKKAKKKEQKSEKREDKKEQDTIAPGQMDIFEILETEEVL